MDDELITKSVKQSAHYMIGRMFMMISGLIYFPIYTRIFTRGEYGDLNLVLITVTLGSILANMGQMQSAVRFYKELDKKRYYTVHLLNVIAAAIATATVLYLAVIILRGTMSNRLYGMLLIAPVLLIARCIFMEVLSFYRASQRTKLYNIVAPAQIYISIFTGLAIAVFLDMRVLGLVIGMAISEIIMVIVLVYSFRTDLSLREYDRDTARDMIRYGLPFILMNTAYLILSAGDRYIIAMFLDSASVGIYSAGYNLCNIMQEFIVAPILMAAVPIVYEIWRTDREKALDYISKYMEMYIYVALYIIFFMSIFSKDIILVLATKKYLDSINIIPIVIGGVILYGYYLLAFSPVYSYLKVQYRISLMILIMAIFNIMLNLILVPMKGHIGGITGAAIATLISYAIFVLIISYDSTRYVKMHVSLRPFAQGLLALVISSAMYYGLTVMISLPQGFYHLLAHGIITTATYFLMVIILDRRLLKLLNTLKHLIKVLLSP